MVKKLGDGKKLSPNFFNLHVLRRDLLDLAMEVQNRHKWNNQLC
jgi:hypothetical protein